MQAHVEVSSISMSFAIRHLFPTSFLSVFLSSSSSSSSPVTSHLFALRLTAFHTFSGTTYLSEQTQNALQRCCERYLPLPEHLLARQLDSLHYFQHVLQSISELISQFKVLGIMGNAGCVRVRAPKLGQKLNGILHLCTSPDFKTQSHSSSPHFLAPLFLHDHI